MLSSRLAGVMSVWISATLTSSSCSTAFLTSALPAFRLTDEDELVVVSPP